MADLINLIKILVDVVLEYLNSYFSQINVLGQAFGTVITGYTSSLFILPGFIAGIIAVCVQLMILLRILGR